MIVRPYTDADLGAILDLHRRQGLDYDLPPLEDMAASVLIEEGANITHALFLRPTLEAYWLMDPSREWKRQRLARLLVLHKEGDMAALRAGYSDVNCWVPPDVLDRSMDNTMMKLGWRKPLWTCYSRDIVPVPVEV